MAPAHGKLELTWSNKDMRLLSHDDVSYEWVDPSDWRVSEVRLLREDSTVGAAASGNLLVQGDALHALAALSVLPDYADRYVGQVKLCYIDPPFNTGQAFEQYDDSVEHSVWLTMLRDRLVQIKKLLRPDGSVWVHLDDSEVHRSRSVLDEVFGAEAFVASIIWRSSDNSNNDALTVSTDHNTLLVYRNSADWRANLEPATPERLPHFKNPDNNPRGPWFAGNPVNSPKPRPNLTYDVVSPSGVKIPPPPNGWRWSKETMRARIATGEIEITADNKVRRITYLADHAGLPPSSLWTDLKETGHNRQAKYELKKLFPGLPTSDLFATPKPERLLQKILRLATDPGDLVLDCFAGSGTTPAVAHKMGRRWVAIERSPSTVDTFIRPRLAQVIANQDAGGITATTAWAGGGGFDQAIVGPSMFEAFDDTVVLAEWATGGALAQAVAAQLKFRFDPALPFAGRKGRSRLAVLDGMLTKGVADHLVGLLSDKETLTVVAQALEPGVEEHVRAIRPGSRARKVPRDLAKAGRLPSRLVKMAPSPDGENSD